jgi:Peptidase family M23
MEILHSQLRARALALVALVTAIVIACAVGPAAQASSASSGVADGSGAWLRPVDGAVVRPFEDPASVYGPGHRGVDLAAAPGTPVRAANAGVVSFAGAVAGTLHVTITHAGGLRTSYSFLASVAVREGQTVARGDVVGTTGGTGPDHDGSVLHLGLRVGDRYVDPMALFRPDDLTQLVHLVPTDEPAPAPWSTASERRELQASLRLPLPSAAEGVTADESGSCGSGIPLIGGAVDAVCDVGGWLGDRAGEAVDAGIDYLDAVTDLGAAAIDTLRAAVRDSVARMRSLSAALASAVARTPVGMVALDVVAIGRRLATTLAADCSDDAPPADGTGGSGHRVMVVAGIDSSGAAGSRGATLALDVEALGYHPDEGEVRYFSYAADGGTYTARDTHGPIEVAAARLGEQLRAMQREQPGREVDLIAHSQGGVVVDYFLTHDYHSGDLTLPPLGDVVALSSPLEGAPLATAGEQIDATPAGRLVLEGAEVVASVPNPESPAVRELAEGSSLLRHLWDHGAPEHFDFTTIGATEDLVVPATQISAPGATETVVAGDDLTQHSSILTDPDALRAVRAALEGRAPPCVSLATALRSAVAPVVISRIEHTIGSGAAAALGGTDR